MSAHATPMTPEAFLAWEEKQEYRWEFDGIRPLAMVGVTNAHSTIQINIVTSLNNRLRGRPCRPHGGEMMVATDEGRYRYPDASVTCTPMARGERLMTEPVVLFEVLSDSTAQIDKVVKLIEYRMIPTVQRYVMAEQDHAILTVIARTPTGWSLDTLRPDRTLAMPEIGIEVPVAEFYLDVELPPPPD